MSNTNPTQEIPIGEPMDSTESLTIEEPTDTPPELSPSEFEKHTGYVLCGSYFFTTWNVRADEWATAVFLSYIFPTSLLPVSLYTLSVTLSAILFSSAVGGTVDRYPRFKANRAFLLLQKLAIALSALALYLTSRSSTPRIHHTGLAFTCIIGMILRLANIGATISVEKDWVIVLAGGRHKFLTSLNSHLRRIDLICKLLAPLAVSGLGLLLPTPTVMLVVAGMSTATVPIEWGAYYIVYKRVPELHVPKTLPDTSNTTTTPNTPLPAPTQTTVQPPSLPVRLFTGFKSHIITYKTFTHHPLYLTTLSISLLYFTVLSFNSVMISYLLLESYSPALVSAMRFLAVLSGLSSTFAFSKMVARLGLVRTGLWSVWMEFGFLVPVVASFWVSDVKWKAVMMFGGVVGSRFGLWCFDLSQMQVVQER
ncbi:hypothetical protein HDV00_004628 [Rhizophlyctis rosea]|nr:hypothetical protein HDV00_004628 [Rhizophlyctis rosea]